METVIVSRRECSDSDENIVKINNIDNDGIAIQWMNKTNNEITVINEQVIPTSVDYQGVIFGLFKTQDNKISEPIKMSEVKHLIAVGSMGLLYNIKENEPIIVFFQINNKRCFISSIPVTAENNPNIKQEHTIKILEDEFGEVFTKQHLLSRARAVMRSSVKESNSLAYIEAQLDILTLFVLNRLTVEEKNAFIATFDLSRLTRVKGLDDCMSEINISKTKVRAAQKEYRGTKDIILGEQVTETPEQILLTKKREKWQEIKTIRDIKEQSGFAFGGKIIESDSLSVMRLNTAAQMALLARQANQPFKISWATKDGSVVSLNAEQMLSIPVAMGMHSNALHTKARTYKEQIFSATTADEVNAVMWVD